MAMEESSTIQALIEEGRRKNLESLSYVLVGVMVFQQIDDVSLTAA